VAKTVVVGIARLPTTRNTVVIVHWSPCFTASDIIGGISATQHHPIVVTRRNSATQCRATVVIGRISATPVRTVVIGQISVSRRRARALVGGFADGGVEVAADWMAEAGVEDRTGGLVRREGGVVGYGEGGLRTQVRVPVSRRVPTNESIM
jgi:hypothetical protein